MEDLCQSCIWGETSYYAVSNGKIHFASCAGLGTEKIGANEQDEKGRYIVTDCPKYQSGEIEESIEKPLMPPSTTGTEIQTYIGWLQDKLSDTQYGEIGLIFNVKEAKVCMVDKIEKIKYKLT